MEHVEAPLEHASSDLDPRPGHSTGLPSLVAQRFDVYARVCLVASLLVAPVVVDARNVTLIKLSVLWFFGVLAIGFFVSSAMQRRTWFPFPRLGYPALAFAAAFALATAFSASPAGSILGIDQRNIGLVPTLLGVSVMFLVTALYWRQPSMLGELAWASAVGAVVLSGYVLIQAAGLDWAAWGVARRGPTEFPVGTMGNSNFAGGYLAIAAPLVLYAVVVTQQRRRHRLMRSATAALLGLALVALWQTHNRGGMLAVFAAFATMAAFTRHKLPHWTKVLSVAVAGSVVVALLLVTWHPGLDRPPGPLSRVSTSTLVSRTSYWKVGWEILRDHPLVGTGPDTYYAYYPLYRDATEARRNPTEIADEPHSIFVSHAANLGILGIGSYLLLMALALVYGARRLNAIDDPRHAYCWWRSSARSSHTWCRGSSPWTYPSWQSWAGWPSGRSPRCPTRRSCRLVPELRRPPDDSLARARPLRWPVHLVVALSVMGLVTVGLRPFHAEIKARYGDLRGAIKLQPLEAEHHARAAALASRVAQTTDDPAERLAQLRESQDHYLEALRLRPGELRFLGSLANLNMFWGERVDASHFRNADQWWQRLLATDPQGPALPDGYAASPDSDAQRRRKAGATRLGPAPRQAGLAPGGPRLPCRRRSRQGQDLYTGGASRCARGPGGQGVARKCPVTNGWLD